MANSTKRFYYFILKQIRYIFSLIKWRLLAGILIECFLFTFKGGITLFYGIPVGRTLRTIPIFWIFQLILPALVIGDSVSYFIKKSYPRFFRAKRDLILLLIFIFVGLSVSVIYIPLTISVLSVKFKLYVYLNLLAVAYAYALLSILFEPVYVLIGLLTLLMVTSLFGVPTFISQTMLARFNSFSLGDLLKTITFSLACLFLTYYQLNRIDFL